MLNLDDEKKEIINFLNKFLNEKKSKFPINNIFIDQYYKYLVSGKLIRGGIILRLNGKFNQNSLLASSAMELIHTSLLIHDDIMDNDDRRRGLPSMHKYWEDQSENKTDSKHFGESVAITIGDIGFYMANQLLNSIELDNISKNELQRVISEEIQLVGLAQLGDIFFADQYNIPEKSKILEMYRLKTGRYTFSLPFLIFSYLSNLDRDTREQLEKIGENIGIIYQISDDNLGLFGESKTTGKPVGNDLREGKKTYLIVSLLEKASTSDKEKMLRILGKSDITSHDMDYIKKQLEESGVRTQIQEYIFSLKNSAENLIDELNVEKGNKEFIRELLEFSYNRNK